MSVVDICKDTCHYITCGHRGDESVRPNNAKVSFCLSLVVMMTINTTIKIKEEKVLVKH